MLNKFVIFLSFTLLAKMSVYSPSRSGSFSRWTSFICVSVRSTFPWSRRGPGPANTWEGRRSVSWTWEPVTCLLPPAGVQRVDEKNRRESPFRSPVISRWCAAKILSSSPMPSVSLSLGPPPSTRAHSTIRECAGRVTVSAMKILRDLFTRTLAPRSNRSTEGLVTFFTV